MDRITAKWAPTTDTTPVPYAGASLIVDVPLDSPEGAGYNLKQFVAQCLGYRKDPGGVFWCPARHPDFPWLKANQIVAINDHPQDPSLRKVTILFDQVDCLPPPNTFPNYNCSGLPDPTPANLCASCKEQDLPDEPIIVE